MATPREILKHTTDRAAVEWAHTVPEIKREKEETAPQRMLAPQPIRENSVYRRLMRSHDRVHTRHIPG